MKKIVISLLLTCVAFASHAQNQYIDSLKTVLAKTTEPIERFDIINNLLVNINGLSGSVDSADCIQLLQIAQQLNNDSLLATSYNWIGAYFAINKGDNTTALEYYFKAIPLAEKAKDKRRISSLYFDIAGVYVALQNNEEAGKYNRKGGENLPGKSHPLYAYMLVQYQRGMANYFLLRNQPDSALHYCQALIETSRKAKSPLFEYNAMHFTAAAYAASGEKEMAEIYFKKSIAISASIKGNMARLRFGLNYIPFLLRNNRLAEAKEQAKELLNIGEVNNNNNLKLTGAGFMRQVFDTLHQTDSAYYYSRMESIINASIFSQDNINKTQALAFDEKLRVMEEADRQADERQQRNRHIQFELLAFGIITFIILFLSLSRSIITNTKAIQFLGVIALLIVFEFLNLLLHPFLERVTNHSPPLMLLALVCIAALLVPLHHRLEKWATHRLVEKNKQIRLAAAKKTIARLEGEN